MKHANTNEVARWNAEVSFKDADGREMGGFVLSIEEVDQLQDIVESGPEWTSGMTIDIRLTYAL